MAEESPKLTRRPFCRRREQMQTHLAGKPPNLHLGAAGQNHQLEVERGLQSAREGHGDPVRVGGGSRHPGRGPRSSVCRGKPSSPAPWHQQNGLSGKRMR